MFLTLNAGVAGQPPDELTADLNAVAAEFKATIDNELVAAGKPANGVETSQVEEAVPAS
jgi:hypothetical protein